MDGLPRNPMVLTVDVFPSDVTERVSHCVHCGRFFSHARDRYHPAQLRDTNRQLVFNDTPPRTARGRSTIIFNSVFNLHWVIITV